MEAVSIDNIQIREFTCNDKDLVTEFFDQMGGETRAFFNRNEGNRKTAMGYFDAAAQNTVFFMAEQYGKMIGYVFLWDMDTMIPWLGISVHEEYKGKKLGKKLMDFVIDFAKEKSKGGILLTTHVANMRAQALYERSGFYYMGRHTSGESLYLLRF